MLQTFPVSIKTFRFSLGPNQTVFYPQVTSLRNQEWERVINCLVAYQTQQLIQEQVGDTPATVEQMIGTYEMKNNQRQVLSLSLSNYTYHHQAAHGMTIIKSLTFDMKKEKVCELRDLFKSGSNYVERLSALICEQLKQRDIPLINDFIVIRPGQDFYIADKTLVIYFQLYEITPYVVGFPMFPISVYEIQDIIEEEGPLGRMAMNN